MAAKKKKTEENVETPNTNGEFLKINDTTLSLLYVGFSLFEVTLLAKIMSLANGKDGCMAKNDWFYWYFNTSKNTLYKAINNLKQSNLISIKETRGQMRGTTRHIFVNYPEYHKLIKASLKKKNEAIKTLFTDSKTPQITSQDLTTNTPMINGQKLGTSTKDWEVINDEILVPNFRTIDGQFQDDCVPKTGSSIIDNSIDKQTTKGYGETPPPHCGLTPFDKNDDQLSTLEAIDDETIQTEEEDEMGIPRGETLQKISEYWDTINPIRKYEYTKANGSAAKHIAYSESDNPRNHMDFYSEPEVIQYFLDRNIPLKWIEDNCPNWWVCYKTNQDLKEALSFIEEEGKKS